MWAADMVLGNVFVFSSAAFYDQYLTGDNMWGFSPAADQSVAGAVMMGVDTVVAFVLLAWLFFKAASEGEKSQELLELADQHGVALSAEAAREPRRQAPRMCSASASFRALTNPIIDLS